MPTITTNIQQELDKFVAAQNYDRYYLLTDTNTYRYCLPVLKNSEVVRKATQIVIKAGDANKNIEQVSEIWSTLSYNGASRSSLLINLGGGMVTDLGGFAGATFKRGLHNINIPTTLMASVDAATGGKTGINFNGLKNEIGAFYQPDCVMIDCTFLNTLDRDNFLSGYAEMIKHGLISNEEHFRDIMRFDILSRDAVHHVSTDTISIGKLVEKSVAVKERIVAEDPEEHGIRKVLNFGHTVGHAFESLSFAKDRPILHGHAVAAGIVCELYLSYKQCSLPVEIMRQVTNYIKSFYPSFMFDCKDYERLYELMTHDKKNEGGHIRCTLLGGIGDIRINQEIGKDRIFESFDFYRENNGM